MAPYHLDTGKRITIELGTQLEIEIEGVPTRFKSSLVGIEPDEYLIIKGPEAALYEILRNKLFRGTRIFIRYLCKGTLFGFRSKLLEAIFTSKQLLFVEYPKTIENYDLRSHERIGCFFPAKIKIKDEEKNGVILDISEGGCRCVIKSSDGEKLPSVQIDERIILRCQFPGTESEQVVSGEVRNVGMDKQKAVLGIQFHEIAPGLQNIIAQYISTVKEFS